LVFCGGVTVEKLGPFFSGEMAARALSMQGYHSRHGVLSLPNGQEREVWVWVHPHLVCEKVILRDGDPLLEGLPTKPIDQIRRPNYIERVAI